MTLETRLQALLDLVQTDRERRCQAIAGAAQARANATRAAARAAALERLRAAFKEERDRRTARIAAAEARLQTHRRLHDQRRAAALLAAAWEDLPDALVRRWLDPPSRQRWAARVVAEARGVLGARPWRIVHAAWPQDERERLAAALTAELATPPEFVADDGVRAGLKISARGNVVDGTLSGLLADRAEIGARLLRHLEDA